MKVKKKKLSFSVQLPTRSSFSLSRSLRFVQTNRKPMPEFNLYHCADQKILHISSQNLISIVETKINFTKKLSTQ